MFSNLEMTLTSAWIDGEDEVAAAAASMLEPLTVFRLPAKYIQSLDANEETLKLLVILLNEKRDIEISRHPAVMRHN
ncbi:hypothetical protein [Agarivorans sp. DSG3-1]|uniref:hypothetical protein n=1 Tax=Agarivorans sp. DSG3-1 TaxID=3342249 RepID=UPI00398F04CA